MPIINNEQDVKAKSQFLDYEAGNGNDLQLISHLYTIDFHYLESARKYVACPGDCTFCENGYLVSTEYNYMVILNGQKGFMNIKGSVFFAIQKIAKAQSRDPRHMTWTVIKTGEGKGTKYTTSKNDNIPDDDYEAILSEIEGNTDKLESMMEKQEEKHKQNYIECFTSARPQARKVEAEKASAIESEQRQVEKMQPDEVVNPDDVPF